MFTLVFATNNQHKVEEMQAAVGNSLQIISLRAAGITIDIPEPHATLEANAAEKSGVIHRLTGQNCFSEDSGLEVAALQGEPGVKSARYAGEQATAAENMEKLLTRLKGQSQREACFRTIISLIWQGQHYLFEGICEGTLLTVPRGEGGFGYDPLFIPYGSNRTFAEMTMAEKNAFSHRRKAADQLVLFLQKQL